MNNLDIVFSRDKLLSEVWGVDYLGESRTVDMHIKNSASEAWRSRGADKDSDWCGL